MSSATRLTSRDGNPAAGDELGAELAGHAAPLDRARHGSPPVGHMLNAKHTLRTLGVPHMADHVADLNVG